MYFLRNIQFKTLHLYLSYLKVKKILEKIYLVN